MERLLFNSSRIKLLQSQIECFPCFTQSIRTKAKKANSSKRNPKQAPGKHYCIKCQDGEHVHKLQVLATQPRLRWHGGLNVGTVGRFTLIALTEGKVIVTAEKADFDPSHSWTQKFYPESEGVTIYKKYLHVIPNTLPNTFKVIDQI